MAEFRNYQAFSDVRIIKYPDFIHGFASKVTCTDTYGFGADDTLLAFDCEHRILQLLFHTRSLSLGEVAARNLNVNQLRHRVSNAQ